MPSQVRSLLMGTAHVERAKLLWWAGLRAGVVIGLLVLAFVVNGEDYYALPVAVGALFAAFSDAGETVGRRWRTMLWTTTWLMVAALLGGFAGDYVGAGVVMVAVIAFICGFVGAAGPRAALGGVLTLVVYVIFSGAPDSQRLIVDCALIIGLGGLVMTAVTVIPHLLRPGAWQVAVSPVPSFRDRMRGHGNLDDDFLRHGVRLAIIITIATVFVDVTPWPHDYWLPMTIAWVTKPDARGTTTKIIARISGTIAGVLLTAAVVDVLDITPIEVAVLVGIAAAVTVAFLWANYAIAVIGITTIVVGLFTFDGDPVGSTIVLRIGLTILAGIMAFLGFYIWPPVRRHHEPSAT